jgi:hypothetical protein
MSQKRLAHEAGIDVRTLRRIESGISVSPESYRAICIALKIEPIVSSESTVDETRPVQMRSLMNRLDAMIANFLAFYRSRMGKFSLFALSLVCILSSAAAVRTWWFRPNVGVTIAFDRSCDERGVWSKAFSAMDHEFPDGYVVKDRIDGAKECTYRFEAYYEPSVGPLDPTMSQLLRRLEHVGTKTTVSWLASPKNVEPRSKEEWDNLNRITSNTVNYWARRSYKKVYTLNPKGIDPDIEYARGLFESTDSFENYVKSLKSSGNHSAIEISGYETSVLTYPPTMIDKDTDDVWTIKFPAKITYSGRPTTELCLAVTMRVKEWDDELGIISIRSEGATCPD